MLATNQTAIQAEIGPTGLLLVSPVAISESLGIAVPGSSKPTLPATDKNLASLTQGVTLTTMDEGQQRASMTQGVTRATADQTEQPAQEFDCDSDARALYTKGDEAAFNAILDKIGSYLLRAAHGILRNDHDSEDVVSAALVDVATHPDKWKEGHSFRGHCKQFVLNYSKNFLKKRNRRKTHEVLAGDLSDDTATEISVELTADPKPTPVEELALRDDARYLKSLILQLPPREQEIIRLKDIDGMSNAEVAEELHESIPAVSCRHQRAKDHLRELAAHMPNNPFKSYES